MTKAASVLILGSFFIIGCAGAPSEAVAITTSDGKADGQKWSEPIVLGHVSFSTHRAFLCGQPSDACKVRFSISPNAYTESLFTRRIAGKPGKFDALTELPFSVVSVSSDATSSSAEDLALLAVDPASPDAVTPVVGELMDGTQVSYGGGFVEMEFPAGEVATVALKLNKAFWYNQVDFVLSASW